MSTPGNPTFDEWRERLEEVRRAYTVYTNADRCEDTEAGRPMDEGSAFYADDDRRG